VRVCGQEGVANMCSVRLLALVLLLTVTVSAGHDFPDAANACASHLPRDHRQESSRMPAGQAGTGEDQSSPLEPESSNYFGDDGAEPQKKKVDQLFEMRDVNQDGK